MAPSANSTKNADTQTNIRSILRHARSAVAPVAMVLLFTNAAIYTERVPVCQPIIVPKASEISILMSIQDVIDSRVKSAYKKDGKIDINELKSAQDDFFNFLKDHAEQSEVNGISDLVIRLIPTILKVSEVEKIDPYLIAAVVQSESYGYEYSVGDNGRSLGLTQINVYARRDKIRTLEYKDIIKPENNIRLASRALKYYINEFNGNLMLGLEAYNAGPGKLLSNHTPRSSKEYAEHVLELKDRIREYVENNKNANSDIKVNTPENPN